MRFTPHYTVSYRGSFHKAGKTFNIDSADAEEMSKHGTVEKPVERPTSAEFKNSVELYRQDAEHAEKAVRRAGRPRKTG